jgi:hypothetical protein
MALKGTLKDFGIADILQLIGQQQKSGTLFLRSTEQEVQIGFKDGNIVKAESSSRRKKQLIGNMLVRAELITEAQLQEALDTQRRTLKRLGDVLVSSKAITQSKFRQMCQLQASETLYGLFLWKSGTYAFEQGDLDYDSDALQPLRAESVLMEGFRMVDEWPLIRRRITGYEMTFEKLKALPPGQAARSIEDDLDAAFGEEPQDKPSEPEGLGESERRVYELATPDRKVRTLIDLSCLGEFETCKALFNLVNQQYLKAVAHAGAVQRVGRDDTFRDRVLSLAAWTVSIALVLAVPAFIATALPLGSWSLGGMVPENVSRPEVQRFLSRPQLARISAALDVYRLEKGELPAELKTLVQAGLLLPDDLRYPWRDDYYYRRIDGQRFVLLPPFR